jgi:hypothetical protein
VGTGVFRRPFWAPRPSQSPLGVFSITTGPVNTTLAVTEQDDTIAAVATIETRASLALTEGDDVASAAGTLDIVSSAFITEADDTLSAIATLGIAATAATTEADDVPSAASTLGIVGALAITESDDTLAMSAAIGVTATTIIAEGDDTVDASALMPIFYPRRGGADDREDYDHWLKQWHEQLRLIIDRSFKIANGEIDPVTFEPIPPPDYSPVVAAMISQALSIDQARAGAFMAEQRQLQEDDAMAMLLLS